MLVLLTLHIPTAGSISSYLFVLVVCFFLFFFFNDTPTTEIYTLSLHDALRSQQCPFFYELMFAHIDRFQNTVCGDRKSTRLNSSHRCISYAVFCLKKKKTELAPPPLQAEEIPHEERRDETLQSALADHVEQQV